MSTHTLSELYETLTSGGKFRLRFNCREEAVEFRSRIATHKYRVEKDLKAMGVIEHMTLSMDYSSDDNIATFYLREPDYKSSPIFEVLEIIPPPPQQP
jgi:hypothetical protein